MGGIKHIFRGICAVFTEKKKRKNTARDDRTRIHLSKTTYFESPNTNVFGYSEKKYLKRCLLSFDSHGFKSISAVLKFLRYLFTRYLKPNTFKCSYLSENFAYLRRYINSTN